MNLVIMNDYVDLAALVYENSCHVLTNLTSNHLFV